MKSLLPGVQAHLQMKERRIFIGNLLKASMASAFALTAGNSLAADFLSVKKQYTVGEIIDMVIKDIPGSPFPKTVDTLKSGNKDIPVTGIVTTMFATIDIIHQAIKLGANFIIAHEPTFYNHTDDPEWVSPNHIVKQKQELLEKNKITVWRCHDYLHSFTPDFVAYGVVQKAGWTNYFKAGSRMLTIPAIGLEALAVHLKKSLDIQQVRVIGNLSQKCETIALMPGASGGQSHLSMVEKERPDVLVVGEVHEWETAEYIRDTQMFGEKTALIVLGHSVSEEPGLEQLKTWLQPKLEGIKVTHLISGNPFKWV